MTTTNSPAGQPTYTAAQYEERIERLHDRLQALVRLIETPFDRQAKKNDAVRDEIARCRAALSTERAHRTAEAAGMTGGYHVRDAACAQRRGASDGMGPMASESEVERARRLA